jgi:Ser/Thr protein kinase RdoA (MazF antagonist)
VIRRVADELPAIRRYLMEQSGTVPLHGDVHSGNAMIRSSSGRLDAVLLDWGRSRMGSPLEDVASWLQSLAYWEPEVRRSHDTLLARYLEWAGRPSSLIRELRRLYWLAAASNGMAGALRYHLLKMLNPSVSPAIRQQASFLAADWLRIIRRADEYWQSGDECGRQSAELRSGRRRTVTP